MNRRNFLKRLGGMSAGALGLLAMRRLGTPEQEVVPLRGEDYHVLAKVWEDEDYDRAFAETSGDWPIIRMESDTSGFMYRWYLDGELIETTGAEEALLLS